MLCRRHLSDILVICCLVDFLYFLGKVLAIPYIVRNIEFIQKTRFVTFLFHAIVI